MANKAWAYARRWHNENFGLAPSLDLLLNGPRLFGVEKEPPDDLKTYFIGHTYAAFIVAGKKL